VFTAFLILAMSRLEDPTEREIWQLQGRQATMEKGLDIDVKLSKVPDLTPELRAMRLTHVLDSQGAVENMKKRIEGLRARKRELP
jgi:hypothetical protein